MSANQTRSGRCREPSAEETEPAGNRGFGIRGPTELPLLAGTNAMVVHQPRHPIAPDLSSLRCAQHALRAAVATCAIAIHATDFLDQLAIGGRLHAFRSPSTLQLPLALDVQHFAIHHTQLERRSLVMDKAKSHFGGPEKMPMASSSFFKMSSSSEPVPAPSPGRWISACSADVHDRRGASGRPGHSARLAGLHASDVRIEANNSLATCVSGRPLDANNDTASCLNSSSE